MLSFCVWEWNTGQVGCEEGSKEGDEAISCVKVVGELSAIHAALYDHYTLSPSRRHRPESLRRNPARQFSPQRPF